MPPGFVCSIFRQSATSCFIADIALPVCPFDAGQIFRLLVIPNEWNLSVVPLSTLWVKGDNVRHINVRLQLSGILNSGIFNGILLNRLIHSLLTSFQSLLSTYLFTGPQSVMFLLNPFRVSLSPALAFTKVCVVRKHFERCYGRFHCIQ